MYCWKCGAPMSENEKYCPDCKADQCLKCGTGKENWPEKAARVVGRVAVGTVKAVGSFALEIVKETVVSVLTEAVLAGSEKAGKAIKKKVKKALK